MKLISLQDTIQHGVLEIRGDGKAGSGLLLAMQSFASLCLKNPNLHVQEWPFFSSSRKGAAVRSFVRVSRKPITLACEVTHPHMVVLMDEGAAKFVDFASGVSPGGTFIVNTHHTPKEVATHYRLSGQVIAINGDRLAEQFLGIRLSNIAVYGALIKATACFEISEAEKVLQNTLNKRRLPPALKEANLKLFRASLEACHTGVYDECQSEDHPLQPFEGYGQLPLGAQTAHRLSRGNPTANYAATGHKILFQDPHLKCNGCSHCIINCPENIIQFKPDTERGVLVTGANFTTYCKHCRECIEVCPEKLFSEHRVEEKWA